jgi:hypothetical protein
MFDLLQFPDEETDRKCGCGHHEVVSLRKSALLEGS